MRKILLLLLVSTGLDASVHDEDEGIEGSIRLSIPEPMVYDLVRPLGAARGEVEVNSLFQAPGEESTVEWAPEVEVAIRKGTALEFELPVAGAAVTHYKFAMQQTLPAKESKWFTHGVQGIGEVARHGEGWSASGTYIVGLRMRPRWSTLAMYGVEHSRHVNGQNTKPLMNHTLFHERWKRTALGVETNLKGLRPSGSNLLIMPQAHFRLLDRVNLQIGAGYSRTPQDRRPRIAWRLVREL